MNKLRMVFVCLILGLVSEFNLEGQTKFELPENIELKTDQDYGNYDSVMVGAAKWLEETDLDKELDKRGLVNGFVFKWVGGNPMVKIGMWFPLMNIYKSNEQLFYVYLASYSKNCIENKLTFTDTSAIKAGLVSIISVYKKGIGVKKDKEINKIIKFANKNKLDEYIINHFMK